MTQNYWTITQFPYNFDMTSAIIFNYKQHKCVFAIVGPISNY